MFESSNNVNTNYGSNKKMRQYIVRKEEIVSVEGVVSMYENHILIFYNMKLIDHETEKKNCRIAVLTRIEI